MKDFPLLPPSSHKARRLVYFLTFFTFLFCGVLNGCLFSLLFMLAHGTLRTPKPAQKVWICFALSLLGLWGKDSFIVQDSTPHEALACAGLFLTFIFLLRHWASLFLKPLRKACFLALFCAIPGGFFLGFYPPFFIFACALLLAFLCVTGPFTRRLFLFLSMAAGFWLGSTLSFALIISSDNLPEASSAADWRLFALYGLLPLSVGLHMLFARNKRKEDRFADFIPTRLLLWFAVIAPLLWLGLDTGGTLLPVEMLAPLLIVILCGLLPLRSATRGMLAAFLLLINIILASCKPPAQIETTTKPQIQNHEEMPQEETLTPMSLVPMEAPHE